MVASNRSAVLVWFSKDPEEIQAYGKRKQRVRINALFIHSFNRELVSQWHARINHIFCPFNVKNWIIEFSRRIFFILFTFLFVITLRIRNIPRISLFLPWILKEIAQNFRGQRISRLGEAKYILKQRVIS